MPTTASLPRARSRKPFARQARKSRAQPGWARTPFSARSGSRSDKTQRRLREMVEIINKVEPRFGSAMMAYAWYRSEPLPGFSGLTAMQLVRSGRADDVLEYVDAVDAGVYA